MKRSIFPVGPDRNYWSDSSTHVFKDTLNRLHLKITGRNPTTWWCTEVIGDTVLGYGTYEWELASKIDSLDKNVVGGLFTWDDASPFNKNDRDTSNREIDFELIREGVETSLNAQFVVQPFRPDERRHRFELHQTNSLRSVHKFTWTATAVACTSIFDGSQETWAYTGSGIPRQGRANPRMNLWLWQNRAPSDSDEVEIIISRFTFRPIPTDIKPELTSPTVFMLAQNYPNPFNPSTMIQFALPRSSHMKLEIFNILGQQVALLANESRSAGNYSEKFDASGLPSGVYFYRLQAGEFVSTKKLILLR